MKKRMFKYYPEDFGKLTVKVLHMDLNFDVYDDHTTVTSKLKVKTLQNIKKLELNAHDLEVHSVKCDAGECGYDYQKEKNMLLIKFATPIPKGKTITITTNTTCRPTKNVLEGIYFDETPKGAPPQQITQCQQWGFQRIVPCIDDMTAKCTYTTTITADRRYTNIITNGDPVGKRKYVGNNRVRMVYDNTITPMATYLFFLGCGTYATYTREFEYPDGKMFNIELLVPPGSDRKVAHQALEVLYDSIMWIHLFTGPAKYVNEQLRKELWWLIKKRDVYKKYRKRRQVLKLQKEIKQKAAALKMGYKYTGKVYREIGMQNSDFGGMENVGNTTITTNRIMPFPQMTDGALEYMFDVKVHEFYHNLNGSEVTGRSPFEIWLNEAVTVHIEREFFEFCFGEDYTRLGEVLTLLAPGTGILALDAGVASMPVEPDGFNDCNELITSITYVKAPEFVKMIQTVLGKEKFVKGLDLYHRMYKHGNATRKEWIEAMEKVSGKKLQKMAHSWLKKTKYPIVAVDRMYDSKKRIYTMVLTQTNADKEVWQFPFIVALFDANGEKLQERTEFISKKQQKVIFKNVKEPAFVSLNRRYSFYGKVVCHQTNEELMLQVWKDDDIVNRYMAFYQLFDREKTRLLKDTKAAVNDNLVDLYFELLNDDRLMNNVGSQFLAIFASVEDEKYAHRYQDLYDMKKRLVKAIAKKYAVQLSELYHKYNKFQKKGSFVDRQIFNIKHRQLKNLCLGILSILDNSQVHKMIKGQLEDSKSATDRASALRMYLNSSAPDKLRVLKKYEEIMSKHLVSWESFLYIVGGNDSKDYLKIIKAIEKSPHFRIDQSNDQRGLFVSSSYNKKKSLQTAAGRAFLKNTIVKLAKINEYTTGRILTIFGNVEKMEKEYWVPVMKVMVDVLKSLDVSKQPSVCNTLKRIISKLPKARKAYERKHGKMTSSPP